MTIFGIGAFVAVAAFAVLAFTGNIIKDKPATRQIDESHEKYNQANEYIYRYGWTLGLCGVALMVVGLIVS